MTNVVPFPNRKPVEGELQIVGLDALFAVLSGRKSFAEIKADQAHEAELDRLRGLDVPTLRVMWDEVGDSSYYHGPHGSADIADIHRILNEKGDGAYCAV